MSSFTDKNSRGMDESTKVVLAALVGAGIGVAATLLFTTERGGKMLEALNRPLQSVSDSLDELATAGKDALDKVGRSAHDMTEKAKGQLADAVKDKVPEEAKSKAK